MAGEFVSKPIVENLLFCIGVYCTFLYSSIYSFINSEYVLGLVFAVIFVLFTITSNKYMYYCTLETDHVEVKTLFGKIYTYPYEDFSKIKYTCAYKENKGFKFFNNRNKVMFFEYLTKDQDEIIVIAEFLIDKGVDVRFRKDWDDSYIQSQLKEKYRRA